MASLARRASRLVSAIGLDVGSTTVKASLITIGAEVTEVHVARTPTPGEGPAILDAAASVLRACTSAAVHPVVAVGIAAMAESGVAWDAADQPLTPLLRWDRARDRRHLNGLLERHPDLPRMTGVPATTKPTLVALAALASESPDAWRRLARWTGPAELVAFALTGVHATDHTLSARTMMADAEGSGWRDEVLAGIGLAPEALPRILAPGEAIGTTGADAGLLGLDRGIPVYVAGHDHAVGAWGAGARSPGQAADSLGTAEAAVRVASHADRAVAVADGFAVGRTVDGRHTTVLGGSRSCGAMLEWWRGQHPGDDLMAVLADSDEHPWRVSRVIVLPYPGGRQCPRPDPAARTRVIGSARSAADRARGVLQSLVSQGRWMRDTADDLAGGPADDLVLFGSLAGRVPAWAPLVAASAQAPLRRCPVSEPVAASAALLAAVRAGEVDSDLTLPTLPVEPADGIGLDDYHGRFLAAVLSEGER